MQSVDHDLATALVDLDALRPHPRNPRNGDVDAIAQSLEVNGQYRPIVLAADGTILAGNHTYAAAMSLGWDRIAAVRLDLAPDSPEALRIMLADNRTADLGNYDDGLLLGLLEAIEQVEGTGYTQVDVDRLHDALDDAPPVTRPSLSDRFGVPPTSVLRMSSGPWQARKRQWMQSGLASHTGRGLHLVRSDGAATDADFYGKKRAREARLGRELSHAEWSEMWESERLVSDSTASGTSTFDPVLCEVVYRWWAPPGGLVFDPCAGGSVRGLVASATGHPYTGLDIRPEQIEANVTQASDWPDELPQPEWMLADATDPCPVGTDWADLLFTCPPYADLERYSDDPRDLSTMDYPQFTEAHGSMIRHGLDALRDNRFAVWVISDVRDKRGRYRGLVADTIHQFQQAGAHLYNDLILAEPIGSQRLFAGRRLTQNRKVARVHQHVLVFVKGDPLAAHAALGPVPEEAFALPDPDADDIDTTGMAEAEAL